MISFFNHTRNMVKYIAMWIIFAFLLALSIHYVSPIMLKIIVVDTLVRTILLAPIAILIHNAIRYGKYEKMLLFHQIISYFALFAILISLWLLLSYAIDCVLLGIELAQQFTDILPIYIFTGFMFYIIVIMFSFNKMLKSQVNTNVENIEKIENTEQNNSQKPDKNSEILERIAVKSGQKIHVIIVPDILYLQAEGDYVQIFTNDGKYLKEQTMKYFESNLPSQFVRVHRSYIINIEAISRIELYERQNQLLTLKNGHKIKISMAGYKLLKLILGL